MSAREPSPAAAVAGLTRSDPRSPGITRERSRDGFLYRDPSGAVVANPQTLHRIGALVIPPAWKDVWISPDPLGHIQATGVDSRGRTQYRYHQVWREQRDAQKFSHMLRFAGALPALRSATVRDLGGRGLDRDRVAAGAVRLIDLGLFRIGGEKYAELDHHYGATTLQKRDVTVTRNGIVFDYIAKEGKRRTITVTDEAVRPVVRALVRSGSTSDSLFCFQDGSTWRPLHTHEVSSYIAARRRPLHREGIPHLERHGADAAAARERRTGADGAEPPERDYRRRPGRGGLAGRHPCGGAQFLHRPSGDQPVLLRRAAAHDSQTARRAARRRRGRDRGRRAPIH